MLFLLFLKKYGKRNRRTNMASARAGDASPYFPFPDKAGREGIPVGAVAERLAIPNSTLSFHLKILKQVGLVQPEKSGTSLLVSVQFDQVARLINFLTEDCCGGRSCLPLMKAFAEETPA